jgi:UDP-N-acetyl-D-galactosamine dehydrogenase
LFLLSKVQDEGDIMKLYEQIRNKQSKLSVIGLGYVGIPLAIAFAKKTDVIGFDINREKIKLYKQGIDVTNEVGNQAIKESTVHFTADEKKLRESKFHIIAVPTPINKDKTPNLKLIEDASMLLGRNLSSGSIVVYESTVYPGVTEELCIPLLEKESGLKCGADFKVGYSPERINPGDRLHRIENIIKVVSGTDDEALDNISRVYELIIEAGVYQAESIRVAEAAKVIENAQRDINIAFMNELSIIFDKLNIDTRLVLNAAKTKWNFQDFTPGLVGGHCIGVDPYYLTYKAETIGYHSQVILAGRRINDDMGKYVAENTVKQLIKANNQIKGARVAIMGITFKENCPDIRNSKVIDIIKELREYDIEVEVTDPIANEFEVLSEYNIQLKQWNDIGFVDAVIIAVKHKAYESIKLEDIKKIFTNSKPVIIDVKRLFDRKDAEKLEFVYWGL